MFELFWGRAVYRFSVSMSILAIYLFLLPLSVAAAEDIKKLAADCFEGKGVGPAQRIESCSRLITIDIVDDTARATALMVRGKLLFQTGETDAALDDHARAIALWPVNPTLYAGRAETFMLMGRFIEAKSDLDRAIELDGEVSVYFLTRGVANIQIGDMMEAISDVEQAVQLDQRSANAHSLLGSLYKEVERYNDALRELEIAIKLDPSIPGLDVEVENLKIIISGK